MARRSSRWCKLRSLPSAVVVVSVQFLCEGFKVFRAFQRLTVGKAYKYPPVGLASGISFAFWAAREHAQTAGKLASQLACLLASHSKLSFLWVSFNGFFGQ